jgi:hypothetical protein
LDSLALEDGKDTSVLNQRTWRNNPEDGRIQFNHDGSKRSRTYSLSVALIGYNPCSHPKPFHFNFSQSLQHTLEPNSVTLNIEAELLSEISEQT